MFVLVQADYTEWRPYLLLLAVRPVPLCLFYSGYAAAGFAEDVQPILPFHLIRKVTSYTRHQLAS